MGPLKGLVCVKTGKQTHQQNFVSCALSSHQVVCQSCSSKKYCLKYLKYQTARVCDQCFLILNQQTSKNDFPLTLFPVTIHCVLHIIRLWKTEMSPWDRHMYILCVFCVLNHVICSSDEKSLFLGVSPGNRSNFAFAKKQKKIPAALKEVADALSWLGSVVFLL